MIIIKNVVEIKTLAANQSISQALARHLERKIATKQKALEPKQRLEDFSLDIYGPLCVLELGDSGLEKIGMPDLSLVIPEWISRLEVSGERYYVLYLIAEDNLIYQLYIPEVSIANSVQTFLSCQPLEELPKEGDGND